MSHSRHNWPFPNVFPGISRLSSQETKRHNTIHENKMALVKTDKNIQKAKLKSKPKPTGYWLRFYVPLDTK